MQSLTGGFVYPRDMSEQVPSVGRVVHYVSLGSADGKFPSVCRAAIVTEVVFSMNASTSGNVNVQSKPNRVGLAVLNPTGLFFDRAIDYDENGKPGTWHWPERV